MRIINKSDQIAESVMRAPPRTYTRLQFEETFAQGAMNDEAT